MLIGVTGQIGAGKSTAAQILKRMGAAIINADLIGRQVVDENHALLTKLTKQFGKDILTKSGRLNRKKLAEKAFKNYDTNKLLNKLVHPYLLKELRQQVKEKTAEYDLVVIDAALLLDWNLDKEVELTIAVHASIRERLRRLTDKGMKRSDALSRMTAQLPFKEYSQRADFVILNNKTPEILEKKIRKIFTINRKKR